MATSGPIIRRGIRRPQVVWSAEHRLGTVGRQLESEAGVDGSIGPIITPYVSIRQAIGMLGEEGGRLFFTEGVWLFDGSISVSAANIHIMSTSPGRTVFKRPSTSTTTTSLLSFTGIGAIVEGIRFIDEVTGALAVVRVDGRDSTVKGCVFEDVKAGVYTTDANRVLVQGNRFISVKDTAVEFAGTSIGGLVSDNHFTPSTDGDEDVYFGNSVTKSGIFSNNFASGGKMSYKGSSDIVGNEDTNVIQAGNVTARP